MASVMASYIVYYGLAAYFKKWCLTVSKKYLIMSCVLTSHITVIKKGQIDVLVRYWNVNLNEVNTRYISSEFMSKAAAEDVLVKFEYASSELDKSKFIQVSSDRPNINVKFLNLLNEKWKDKDLKELIAISTCGVEQIGMWTRF